MNKSTKKEKIVFAIVLAVALVVLTLVAQRIFSKTGSVPARNPVAVNQADSSVVAVQSNLIVPGESPFARPEQPPVASKSAAAELPVPAPATETNDPPVFDENSMHKEVPVPLLVMAMIGKNTAIISDGKATETVWSGKVSRWGRIGAITSEGVYVDDILIKIKYAAGSPDGNSYNNPPASTAGEYRWPDDGGKPESGNTDSGEK